MNKSLKYFVAISVLTILIITGSYFFYRYMVTVPVNNESEQVELVVTPGQSVENIARELQEAGLLDSVLLFQFYVWQEGKENDFKAGRYSLNAGMSIREITDTIASGDTVSDIDTIKVIEGWKLEDIASYMEERGLFPADDFLEVAGYPRITHQWDVEPAGSIDLSDTFTFLRSKPEGHSLEGYLFPDTYEIYTNASPKDAVVKMLSNFNRKFTEKMRADAEERGKTVHEIVTMASLLEEEVRTEEEMRIVSGIFWEKIENNDPLRSCATLAYVLNEDKDQYSTRDTQIESPYNTYQNTGLPPGPVSNPGLKAIKAAIYPKETDYQYFLSPAGSDETVFSKTWEEHLRNKRKYLD